MDDFKLLRHDLSFCDCTACNGKAGPTYKGVGAGLPYLRRIMSRFKDGFKTYHDAYFTILILIDDSRNDFSKFLLLGDVSLARNHDALGLRRAGTVERFRAVAYGGAAKTHVFDEAHDALPFFRWDVIAANKELLADFSNGFPIFADNHIGLEVLFAWHGDHDTAGDIFGKTDDFIGETGDVLLADVGRPADIW